MPVFCMLWLQWLTTVPGIGCVAALATSTRRAKHKQMLLREAAKKKFFF